MSDHRRNESEERIVDEVALEQLSQKESVSRTTAADGRSIDEEAAPVAIQREVEITIQPQEELEVQREQARARGSGYTNIWSESKEDTSGDKATR